jgi:hypothetical protein
MSRKAQKIIAETVARWRNTLTSTAQPDVEMAKKLLQAKAKKSHVFVADSPLQFLIGQSIIRGRLAKYAAVEMCAFFGIDPAFLDNFKRVGGLAETIEAHQWQRTRINSLAGLTAWHYLAKMTNKKPRRLSWRAPREITMPQIHYLTLNMTTIYSHIIPGWGARPAASATQEEKDHYAFLQNLDHKLSFSRSRAVEKATLSLMDAVSRRPDDLIADNFDFAMHGFDGVAAEISSKIMNIKDLDVIANYEIFHHTPLVMEFKNAYLIMGKKPIVTLNADNNLHNESGQAVQWADGTGVWFFDGHHLAQHGEKIIMTPEKLTIEEIDSINNEENRRVAIDRVGWGEYLEKTGATVLDQRENWVDNTAEILIAPGKNKVKNAEWPHGERREPYRMVLACRSTGRKYFLAVPNPHIARGWPIQEAQEPKIKSCIDAQNWLANGSVSNDLPYAKYPLNIVGAS